MAGRFEGKVAFSTGAAHGHALRLAQEGADIVAVDLAGPVDSIRMYPPATSLPTQNEKTRGLFAPDDPEPSRDKAAG